MNRKNAIERLLAVVSIGLILLSLVYMMYRFEVLQETLNEKEKIISDMETQIAQLYVDNEKLSTELEKVSHSLNDVKQENEALRELNTQLKQKVTSFEKAWDIPSRGSSQVAREFYVTSTAYTAYCKGCSGKTAWKGINLRNNPNMKVIAVDPNIIPLGSKVWVEGYGYAIAADTGGAIKGHKIDVFFPDKASALEWGRKTVHIKVF